MNPIDHIATKAAKLARKPNKADCFNIVKRAVGSNGLIPEADLAAIYAFFMPSPPARPKTSFDWVAMATAGKDDVRGYLRYVHCAKDGSRLEATDGHRLHAVKLPADSTYPAGALYDSAGSQINDPTPYPDTSRILAGDYTPLRDSDPKLWAVEQQQTASKRGHVYRINGARFDKGYVDEALSAWNGKEGLKVSIKGAESLKLEYADKVAIVMGIR